MDKMATTGKKLIKERKEMFYLTKKEGNALFNNALNTFYLQLYCKGPLT